MVKFNWFSAENFIFLPYFVPKVPRFAQKLPILGWFFHFHFFIVSIEVSNNLLFYSVKRCNFGGSSIVIPRFFLIFDGKVWKMSKISKKWPNFSHFSPKIYHIFPLFFWNWPFLTPKLQVLSWNWFFNDINIIKTQYTT